MRKPLDIDQLIEQKYEKNKQSSEQKTFSFNDLLSQIDLVLETFDYERKHDTADLEEISPSVGVYDHANGFTREGDGNIRPNEPGYGGKEPAGVVPDKLAELDTTDTNKFVMPDLLSMIVNQNMELGDPDRNLINQVFAKGVFAKDDRVTQANWLDKIKDIQNTIQQIKNTSSQKKGDGTPNNFRDIVKNLIILSILRKIVVNTDYKGSGTLYEYFFAPLFSSKMRVVPGTDNIIDIDLPGSNTATGWKGISLKLLTGKRENIGIKGSFDNMLKHAITQINNGSDPLIPYIICTYDREDGNLNFYPVAIGPDLEQLANFFRKVVKQTSDTQETSKTVSEHDQIFFNAFYNDYIATSENNDNIEEFIKYELRSSDRRSKNIIYHLIEKVFKDGAPPTEYPTSDNPYHNSYVQSNILKMGKTSSGMPVKPAKIDPVLNNLKQFLQNFAKTSMYSKFVKKEKVDSVDYFALPQHVKSFYDDYWDPHVKALQGSKEKESVVIGDWNLVAKKMFERLLVFPTSGQAIYFNDILETDAKILLKDPKSEISVAKFAPSKANLPSAQINLGDKNDYDDLLKKAADFLGGLIKNIFTNLNALNVNLTKFFAPSPKENTSDLAGAAVNNANDIVAGVTQIKSK